MTDRDVIQQTISEYVVKVVGVHWPIPDDQAQLLADRIAAALRESRTVRTADEVPVGAVTRSSAGTIAARLDTARGVVLGDDRSFPWHALAGPLVILFRPDEDGDL